MLELLILLQLTQILVLSLILLVTLRPPPNAAKQCQTDVQLMKQRLRAANPSTPDPLKQKHLAQLWNDACFCQAKRAPLFKRKEHHLVHSGHSLLIEKSTTC